MSVNFTCGDNAAVCGGGMRNLVVADITFSKNGDGPEEQGTRMSCSIFIIMRKCGLHKDRFTADKL
jgi:hypothetical protein